MMLILSASICLASFGSDGAFGNNLQTMEGSPIEYGGKEMLAKSYDASNIMHNSSIFNTRHILEEVPNYLPTGFYDFVSSDQGPTYSYDTAKSTPKFQASGSYPYQQNWQNTFEYDPTNAEHSVSKEKLPVEENYRMIKPYRWYSIAGSRVRKYPEDRLPVANRSARNDEGQQKSLLAGIKKTRKARSVKSIFGNLQPQWTYRTGSDPEYRYPQDFYMLMSAIKNEVDRSDQYMDNSNPLSDLLSDPIPIMVAILLPLSMIVAACLPVLVYSMSNGNYNIPLVTTVATGNNGKVLDANRTEFLSPIMDAIGTFSPRSDDTCIMKTFCKQIKSRESLSLSLQRAISDVSTFVDGYWLRFFQLQTLVESLKDGNCDKIQCSAKTLISDSINSDVNS